jgi:transcription initiation factor IIF auxiliary subunit
MTATHNFQTYSRDIGKKGGMDFYAWCVFLQGSPEEIGRIRQIEYTLHPSFPDPVRVVEDADHCFALESQGWGIFQVRARVTYRNKEMVRQGFSLQLGEDAWPRGPTAEPGQFQNITAKRVYDSLLDEDWDWRKVSTLVRRSGGQSDEVKSILKDMQSRRLARPAPYQSLEGEEMWGATVRVGLLPEPE